MKKLLVSLICISIIILVGGLFFKNELTEMMIHGAINKYLSKKSHNISVYIDKNQFLGVNLISNKLVKVDSRVIDYKMDKSGETSYAVTEPYYYHESKVNLTNKSKYTLYIGDKYEKVDINSSKVLKISSSSIAKNTADFTIPILIKDKVDIKFKGKYISIPASIHIDLSISIDNQEIESIKFTKPTTSISGNDIKKVAYMFIDKDYKLKTLTSPMGR